MRIVFLIVGLLFLSCSAQKENEDKNFSFYLPESGLYITTIKRVGGDFYVMFSKTDIVSELSDSVDYIQCEIEDYSLVIVSDPSNRNNIYYKYPYVKKENKRKLNLIKLPANEFNDKFYHPGFATSPDTLKSPFKVLFIAPMSYNITLQRDSIFGSQIRLKEGDMWGN
jgi:hypothetical protein